MKGLKQIGKVIFAVPILLSAFFIYVQFGGHNAIQLCTVLLLKNNCTENTLNTHVLKQLECDKENACSASLPGKSQ